MPRVGDQVRIHYPDAPRGLITATIPAAGLLMFDATADETRFQETLGVLIEAGQAWMVDNGTEGVVTQVDQAMVRFQITHGPQKGIQGWVIGEFIMPR